ncbi:hypothetical protein OIU84_003857 [Salix udensis]|uniref:Uncharacterized protein n=1 Tax=Salix udensis TaxID=889485 RepID=A0AAD6K2X5_9ROSI|nr:hypothetical protein OIU84_003857 [Salix udensis]
MDLSLAAAASSSFDLLFLNAHKFSLFQCNPNFSLKSKPLPAKSLFWRQNHQVRVRALNDDGFVLEDVPHLTDFLPHLPSYPNPLHHSQAYAIVKQTFVGPEDAVAENIVVRKDSPRGVHFRRAGPGEKFILCLMKCVLA